MKTVDGATYRAQMQVLQHARSRVERAQTLAMTGLKETKGSDAPTWFADLKNADEEAFSLQRSERALSAASRRLTASESALEPLGAILAQLGEVTTQGGSDLLSARDRASLAQTVRSLKASALALANTRTDDGYTFGGLTSNTAPFDPAGNFVGSSDVLQLQVNSEWIGTGVDAAQIFNPAAGVNIFALFDTIASALDANDGVTTRAQLDAVRTAVEQTSDGRSELGDKLQLVSRLDDAISNSKVRLSEQRAKSVEIDPLRAYSELAQASGALEAALKVSSQAMKLSLVDYI